MEYKFFLSPTYTALQQREPGYLLDKLNLRPPGSTRSSSLVTLQVPSVKHRPGKRSFSYAAPHLWNSLPNCLRQPAPCPQSGPLAQSRSTFLRQLETPISSFLSTVIDFNPTRP